MTRKITISGKNLAMLERYYDKEMSAIKYDVTFAEFLCKNALANLEASKK